MRSRSSIRGWAWGGACGLAVLLAMAPTARAQWAPENFDPDKCLPPLQKNYRNNPQQLLDAHQRWSHIIYRKPSHKQFSGCGDPPPPSDPPPPPQQHDFDSILEGELSFDGGFTFDPISVPAAVSVIVTFNRTEGDKDIYDTEIVVLDVTGLPMGARIRESPAFPSVGVTTIRPVPGGYMISSYFDVYTELSLDGGTTWIISHDEFGVPMAGHMAMAPEGLGDGSDSAVNHDIEVAGSAGATTDASKVQGDIVWISESTFDTGAPCAAGGWTVAGPGELPPGAGVLYSHPTDPDRCAENTTCAWLFTEPFTPACAPNLFWGPGGATLPAGVDQYLYSPLIDLTTTPAAAGTILSFRNLPGNSFPGARIVLNTAVRSLVGGVFTPWASTGSSSLGLWSWVTRTLDLSALVSPAATDIQVRFRVADWGPAGLGCATTAGAECGPGPGPYIDLVRIGRELRTGPVISEGIDSRSQAQDCFPAALNAIPPEHYSPTLSRFGTCPFSAGADETTCGAAADLLTTDAISVRVVDARGTGGIAAVKWYGAIVAGPHAGKAPAPYVVGANGFFEVAPVVDGDRYWVDLDDTYFRGGDVLVYFWTATDMGGGFTSDPAGLAALPGSIRAAEVATGGLLEVSFLPAINWDPTYLAAIAADPTGDLDPTPEQIAGSWQHNCFLYVQMEDSRRRSGDTHRTSFMYTLDRLGYRGHYDVYDVQGFGNTNNHLGGRATVAQATGYMLIVQDSGRRRTAQLPDGLDLDSEKVDQAGWYDAWLAAGLTSEAGRASLWLVGENLAQYNAAKPLLAATMGVTLTTGNQGVSPNPNVPGMTSFTWADGCFTGFAGDNFSLDGGCSLARDYDGLGAAGTAVVTHNYRAGAVTGPGAVVMKKNAAAKWNTVLTAFSWGDIRDASGAPPGRPELVLAGKILSCALPIECLQPWDPTGGGDDPTEALPRKTALHPAVPNPFNPTTTLRFELARESDATLSIFDTSGRLLRTLVQSRMTPGMHTVIWDGTDGRGHRAASGIYFARLTADDFEATRRLVLMK